MQIYDEVKVEMEFTSSESKANGGVPFVYDIISDEVNAAEILNKVPVNSDSTNSSAIKSKVGDVCKTSFEIVPLNFDKLGTSNYN